MNPSLAALTALALIGGTMILIAGIRRRPVTEGAPPTALQRRLRALRGTTRAQRRHRRLIAASVLVGALLWLLTGWFLIVLLLPAAVAGMPYLLQLSDGTKEEIARLEAMSDWTRNLAGVLTVGVGIEQAISTSLNTCPQPIRTEVERLVARLNAHWETELALRGFADDLNDATGDLIAAALILGARQRGTNLSDVLEGLANTVAEDVKVRRDVAAEQEKPRTRSRWITGITAAGVTFLLLHPYSEPYRTPFGQIFLIGYLAAYVACLIWLRRTTVTPRQPRILGAAAREQQGVPA